VGVEAGPREACLVGLVAGHRDEAQRGAVTLATQAPVLLGELEAIVEKLEGGAAGLEDSIKSYERGERLKARCEQLLKQAEARIEKITLGPDGKAAGTEPMEVE